MLLANFEDRIWSVAASPKSSVIAVGTSGTTRNPLMRLSSADNSQVVNQQAMQQCNLRLFDLEHRKLLRISVHLTRRLTVKPHCGCRDGFGKSHSWIPSRIWNSFLAVCWLWYSDQRRPWRNFALLGFERGMCWNVWHIHLMKLLGSWQLRFLFRAYIFCVVFLCVFGQICRSNPQKKKWHRPCFRTVML